MDRKASRISSSAMLLTIALTGAGAVTPALCADGVIVLTRDVQPRVATRAPLTPDPNPHAVDANVSPTVHRALGSYELSDQDFAGISSGAGLQRQAMPGGQLPGLGASSGEAGRSLPNMRAGHSGGAGASISNQVTRSLQQGLAPLKAITGDR